MSERFLDRESDPGRPHQPPGRLLRCVELWTGRPLGVKVRSEITAELVQTGDAGAQEAAHVAQPGAVCVGGQARLTNRSSSSVAVEEMTVRETTRGELSISPTIALLEDEHGGVAVLGPGSVELSPGASVVAWFDLEVPVDTAWTGLVFRPEFAVADRTCARGGRTRVYLRDLGGYPGRWIA